MMAPTPSRPVPVGHAMLLAQRLATISLVDGDEDAYSGMILCGRAVRESRKSCAFCTNRAIVVERHRRVSTQPLVLGRYSEHDYRASTCASAFDFWEQFGHVRGARTVRCAAAERLDDLL
jgi:hypothetical protein